MKLASLFAGIGGIDLGFEQAGFEPVWANEIDIHASKTFALNHDKVDLVVDDICNIKAISIPSVDVLAGGFPCQAFSVAGYRKGFEDDRGNLFFQIIRLLSEMKDQNKLPKVVFLENVKNLRSHDNGRTFAIIKEKLEELGYHIETNFLNSMDYANIPQNRERTYIVAFLDICALKRFKWPQKIVLSDTLEKFICRKSQVDEKYYYRKDKKAYSLLREGIKNKNLIYQFRRVYVRENKSGVSPTLTANMGTGGHNVPLILDDKNNIRKLTPRECLNLQGFPSNFKIPTEMADSQIYKQAGNSVTVPVIRRIAEAIKNAVQGMLENPDSKKINYNESDIETYIQNLKLVGSLSNIFSDSPVPFLHYRAAEMAYCSSFKANNLARVDVSVDAKIQSKGIGIKTFVATSKIQKIAEFNKQQELYKDLESLEKVKRISELRNARLQFTSKAYGLERLFYHCILRDESGFFLCEEDMKPIAIERIKLTKKSDGLKSLFFTDGIEEYKFDTTKSTLYKKFDFEECFKFVPINVLENPLEDLGRLDYGKTLEEVISVQSAIIPLYSYNPSGEKRVYPKSGLNFWNARGRDRDYNEIYIPFNKNIRELYEFFFPPRNDKFEVELPNGKTISMKICQEDGKAIMSDPNKDLGEWLLRDVLGIKEGTILEYKTLLEIGIDAVEFQKLEPLKYRLNFKEVGDFEEYLNVLDR